MRAAHEGLAPGVETESRHRVAGRIVARRGHGKACFLDLRDGSGQIQLHAREDLLGAEAYELLVDLDIGDIVGVEGTAMATRRGGELSLAIDRWRLLAKSLRPPPERVPRPRGRRDPLPPPRARPARQRGEPPVFATRARTIAEIRRWLDEHGFIEVETPVLQPLYGGALARPFTTHHNQLDRDFYLRIATELYLKRLVVGGIDRVYELGKDFRNEGVSHKHNPEFTMLEWYEAYADYGKTARRPRAAGRRGRRAGARHAREVERDGETIDFAPPWRRVTLREAIRERAGIDIAEHPTREALAEAIGTEPDPKEGWGKLVDGLLSKSVEPALIQPTFVLDYPVELSPFAKAHRSEEGLVERWEAFVGGVEIANSFTELNDPDEQRRRFEQQRGGDRARRRGGPALRRGLRRGARTGDAADRRRRLGIDRLVMMLTGAKSLREVMLFPAMRT